MAAPHDVFICYSSEDLTIAEAACDRLEAAGIECWMAPRDPIAGVPYGRQIVEAIASTQILLLIFSSKANASPHVLSELELAYKRGKTIVPFRIESVLPDKDLEYYIQRVHWLDALTPPLESRLDELVELTTRTLSDSKTAQPPEPQTGTIDETAGPTNLISPEPVQPGEVITWRSILFWYGAAIALAVAGSYLAYGPLTSDSWHRWAVSTRTNVVFLDTSRVVIAALLALFALHNLDVIPSLASRRRRINGRFLEPYERIVVGVFVALFLLCAYYVLPENFKHLYALQIANHQVTPSVSDPLSFGEIFGPYIPYSLYVAGLWLGIVFPVLFFLIRSVRYDLHAWKRLQGALDVIVPNDKLTRSAVASLVIASNDVLSLLKESAGRYLPIFLVVITMVLVEELSPLKRSVLEQSADIGKLLLWLLWIPTLIVSIALFTILYDGEVKHAKNALSLLIGRLKNFPARTKELQDATKALRDIGERETSVKALFDILKTGSVGVYALVVTLSALTVAVLRFHENWARAFVPQSFIDWLANAAGLGKH